LESKHHQSHRHNTEIKDNGIIISGETPDEHVTRRPPNSDAYRLRFENQTNVMKIHGRPTLPWSTLNIISQKKYNTDYANLTNDADKATTIEMATEMWKATLSSPATKPV
jgi:hypothetical protein